ncbi:MAG: WbqC family protein [Flavobacteriales bacterium]|nr:WbqC family protein [Flavobacteriales bacterium]
MDHSQKLLVSTAFFPPVSYVHALLSANEIWLEAHEHYVKQSYRNRCYIYGANGILRLTAPVDHGKGEHIKVTEVKLSTHHTWKNQIWKSLQTAYRTSPFFEYYEEDLADTFHADIRTLFEWNFKLLSTCLSLIGIEKNIQHTTSYIPAWPEDTIDIRQLHPKSSRGISLSPPANSYHQVFEGKHGFIPNLSILDLMFNLGPRTINYLMP